MNELGNVKCAEVEKVDNFVPDPAINAKEEEVHWREYGYWCSPYEEPYLL
jgi:hypothetical protein